MDEMRGSKMIKVVGILMTIFGGIGLLAALVALIGIPKAVEAAETWGIYMDVGMLYVAVFLSLLGGGIQLTTGILGILYCRAKEKMGVLTILSFVMMGMVVINFIFALVNESNIVTTLFGFIIGLILPILLFVGIKQNK